MKYLIIAISLFGCQQNEPAPQNQSLQAYTDSIIKANDSEIKANNVQIDSSSIRLGLALKYLDSNLTYGRKSQEYKIKSLTAEVNYRNTGEEKYYNQAVKYDNLRVKYAKKANRFYDSSQLLTSK